ncbi:hypothetical protein ACV56Z_10230 [Staphylococcus aureus]
MNAIAQAFNEKDKTILWSTFL